MSTKTYNHAANAGSDSIGWTVQQPRRTVTPDTGIAPDHTAANETERAKGQGK